MKTTKLIFKGCSEYVIEVRGADQRVEEYLIRRFEEAMKPKSTTTSQQMDELLARFGYTKP